MSWTSGRLRNDRATGDSQESMTTSERPSTPSAASAALASLVFGASKPQLSMTRTLPSLARSDSAERVASLIIFFGVRWA